MDSSALANSIKSLEVSLDWLEVWLFVFTACVVVGLVIEYGPEMAKAIRGKNWSALRTPAIIGGVLVTGGVAGELLIQFRAASIETKLRAKNAEVFAVLNKESSDARLAAEQEQLARVKLQRQVAWRTLTTEQQERIIEKLKAFAGQQYRIAVSPDPESMGLFEIIDQILGRAGMVRLSANSPVTTGDGRAAIAIKSAVHVHVPPAQNPKLVAVGTAITDALNAEGIRAFVEAETELEKTPTVVNIIVGSKPL